MPDILLRRKSLKPFVYGWVMMSVSMKTLMLLFGAGLEFCCCTCRGMFDLGEVSYIYVPLAEYFLISRSMLSCSWRGRCDWARLPTRLLFGPWCMFMFDGGALCWFIWLYATFRRLSLICPISCRSICRLMIPE